MDWLRILPVYGTVLMGLLAALGLALVLYAAVGWLGVGLVGLFGLVISLRLKVQGGSPGTTDFAASDAVSLHAKQLEQQRGAAPEQKLAEQAEAEARGMALYLVNTFCIALMALGFALFVVHDL